jgi:hypothetical protein
VETKLLGDDSGQTLIVDVLDAEGETLYRDEAASFTFLKTHVATLAFEKLDGPALLPEPPRIRPLAGDRGKRPAGIAIKLSLKPVSAQAMNANAIRLDSQTIWIPRAGMEAASQ